MGSSDTHIHSTTQQAKHDLAQAALSWLPPDDVVIGVGTGSTVASFIEALGARAHTVYCAIPSSEATRQLLEAQSIPVGSLQDVSCVPLYVDGADEATSEGVLIKGRGGALTREKIVAAASDQFLCLIDASKLVPVLGQMPVPLEVIEMARSLVARAVMRLGGRAVYRAGYRTDEGHIILDVHGLDCTDPWALAASLRAVPGVITVGLFTEQRAHHLLVADGQTVRHVACQT